MSIESSLPYGVLKSESENRSESDNCSYLDSRYSIGTTFERGGNGSIGSGLSRIVSIYPSSISTTFLLMTRSSPLPANLAFKLAI